MNAEHEEQVTPNTPSTPADASRTAYGGQAVIEGVMIRGRANAATAVRLPDGSISVRRDPVDGWTTKRSILNLAFLRGTPALIDSLRLGYRTLMWSADLAMEAEPPPPPKGKVALFFHNLLAKIPPQVMYGLSIAFALAFGIVVFRLFPTWLLGLALPKPETSTGTILEQLRPSAGALIYNIGEGVLNVLILVGYIVLIGRSKDIRRVFSYHGAEHKTVNAWEAGAPLTVEGVKPYSRIHPRCGTSFLFLFVVVSILVHAIFGWPGQLLRIILRVISIPIVAGVAYELIRLAGKLRGNLLLRGLVWPGMALQQLTTAEPQDDQIEVALTSMRAVLVEEGVIKPEPAAMPVDGPAVAEA